MLEAKDQSVKSGFTALNMWRQSFTVCHWVHMTWHCKRMSQRWVAWTFIWQALRVAYGGGGGGGGGGGWKVSGTALCFKFSLHETRPTQCTSQMTWQASETGLVLGTFSCLVLHHTLCNEFDHCGQLGCHQSSSELKCDKTVKHLHQLEIQMDFLWQNVDRTPHKCLFLHFEEWSVQSVCLGQSHTGGHMACVAEFIILIET